MRQLILITGTDCTLCLEAKDLIESIDLKDVALVEKDIYTTREIHTKYWDKIPVLVMEEKDLYWPFNQREIKELISI